MPGPAPKHPSERRRRNAPPVELLQIPAGGRKGPTPVWPLETQTPAEAAIWDEIWQTPHAAAWERLEWYRTVARYVRVLVRAEEHNAKTMALAEARQMEDKLGLTPMSMLRLRWEVVPDEVAQKRAVSKPRSRLKAVDSHPVARS